MTLYRRRRWVWGWTCSAIVLMGEALAQVRLPNVQVPQLPSNQLPIDPSGTLNSTTGTLNSVRLRDLRRLRIRELLRTHRRELEADPSGAPIVRAEIAAYAPTEDSLQAARDAGFSVVRENTLSGLDVRIVILAPQRGQSTRAALRRIRSLDPGGSYDYNHVYIESGLVVLQPGTLAAAAIVPSAPSKIGLIDGGIAQTQAVFHSGAPEQFGCETPVPTAHGTAVASLLVGHAGRFSGAAPNATLFAADVYCGEPTGGSLERVAAAFAWLSEKRVAVINVSLVGPKNSLLERIVAALLARGHVIVAAVGNDGPAAPALYPAAYPGVIAVTGVDAKRRILVEACRGMHVSFAAPGSDMSAAGMNDGFVSVRGTSFAAPIIAGLLARKIAEPNAELARDILSELQSEAIDLGSRGVDKVYGHGLLGEQIRIDPQTLAASKDK